MTAHLTFLGGAGTVTGSRFLLEAGGSRVLVDVGLFQGLKDLRRRNWEPFPVPPSSIDAVVLTHAHVDHCGYLPALVRDGFAGPVHCTPGTAALTRIVLPDSGHLHEEEARYANRKGFSKHHPALPLYTEADARVALQQLAPVEFGEEVEVVPGVHVRFEPAGHILGSAVTRVGLADEGRTIVFSGDLGRPHHPLLQPPAPIRDADVVVMESTYGNREHDDADAVGALRDAVVRTAARGGTIVIPAFAVDRTEVVLFHLRELTAAGAIPRLPVYVDSPMALASLGVYRRAIAADGAEIDPGLSELDDPFDPGDIHEVHDVEESKALAEIHVPIIIVSASGMATGGRVVHHLARLLPGRLNTVLLVGFQAPGTRGRLLADGARTVRMLGMDVPVRAEVVEIPAFSVHADRHELCDWLDTASRPPEAVHLVHGEPEASEALADAVARRTGRRPLVAELGQRVEV